MSQFFLALLPTILLMCFFYFKDKYEKEPFRMLVFAFLLGIMTVVPAIIIENYLNGFTPRGEKLVQAFYGAFIVAAFTEEAVKYIFIKLFIWKSPELNEMYDGIIYAVFLSLGFATVENVLYVAQGGISVALLRIFTAVPAHALFGTVMGYYLGKAKFLRISRGICLVFGLFVPIILHGVYDFLLMSNKPLLTLLFIPFMIYLWRRGLKHTNELIERSHFKSGY